MNLSDIPKCAGVYCLRHRATGNCYVGSSVNLRYRIGDHLNVILNHPSKLIAALVAKDGGEFDAEILETTSPAERTECERRWMEKLKPTLNARRAAETRPLLENPQNVVVSTRLTDSEYAALEAEASSDDRTVSYLIAKLIREHLDRAKSKRR